MNMQKSSSPESLFPLSEGEFLLAGDSPRRIEDEFREIAVHRLTESAHYALNALKGNSKLKRANAIQKLEHALHDMEASFPGAS
jgi:hypothetical protein